MIHSTVRELTGRVKQELFSWRKITKGVGTTGNLDDCPFINEYSSIWEFHKPQLKTIIKKWRWKRLEASSWKIQRGRKEIPQEEMKGRKDLKSFRRSYGLSVALEFNTESTVRIRIRGQRGGGGRGEDRGETLWKKRKGVKCRERV